MIDKILDQLFLSGTMDIYGEAASSNLAAHKISHVLTLSLSPMPDEKKVPGVHYKYVRMADSGSQDIIGSEILSKAIQIISDVIEDGGNILVHSEVGSSRGPAIVAGYLMQKFQWSHDKAITFVRMKRPNITINNGFQDQLSMFTTIQEQYGFRGTNCPSEYRTCKPQNSPNTQEANVYGLRKAKLYASKEKKQNDLPSVVISEL